MALAVGSAGRPRRSRAGGRRARAPLRQPPTCRRPSSGAEQTNAEVCQWWTAVRHAGGDAYDGVSFCPYESCAFKLAEASLRRKSWQWRSAAGTTEQPLLDAGVRRLGTEPDGEKRFGEIIPVNRALHRAIDIHFDAHARLVRKGQLLPALHIPHRGLQLLNALLEGWYLGLGVVLKAFLPRFLQVFAVHVAHEVEDELLGGVGGKDGVRIPGLLRHVQRRDIDVNL